MKKVYLALCFGLAFFTSVANAEIVTVKVSATVTYVDDIGNALGGQMNVGDTITGTYTFDTSAPDSDPSTTFGKYDQDLTSTGMSFSVNNLTLATNPSAPLGAYTIEIFNEISFDAYHGRSYDNAPLNTGALLQDLSINFYDPTATAHSSDLLLAEAPTLANYEFSEIHGFGQTSDGLNFFNFNADITTVTLETGAPDGTYQVAAIVRDVYDPYNLLLGKVNIGDALDGSYRVDLHALDSDPAVNSAHYISPADSQFGFNVTINDLNFLSDSLFQGPEVYIYNDISDNYQAEARQGQVVGLGINLDMMAVYLYDSTGLALSSTAQVAEGYAVSKFDIRDFIISGSNANAQYFHITAELVSLTADIPPEVVMSPATDSKFIPYQRFDTAVILPSTITTQPVRVTGTINGIIEPYFESTLCNPWTQLLSGQFVYTCYDTSGILRPGINRVRLQIEMPDGSSIFTQADWTLIE